MSVTPHSITGPNIPREDRKSLIDQSNKILILLKSQLNFSDFNTGTIGVVWHKLIKCVISM